MNPLIEKADRGERITKMESSDSIFSEKVPAGPHSCLDFSRSIVCTNDKDVYECAICGKQWTGPCNFDEDMS